MSVETRDMLLYSQLQEGLQYALMKALSVSGARDYQELCIAACNKEHCLTDFAKQHQYTKVPLPDSTGHRSQKCSFVHEKPQKDWHTLNHPQPVEPQDVTSIHTRLVVIVIVIVINY